ncbi:TonB-dependent receptor plug [Methyloglobulus morosus KoM1]|uniref:TonB-dependent receptor plug n=1 Tax=Methyloglobulus morosus KoM1 TaxID=1116472 RepID=V5BGG6_9GAMM|nr:TonB-dependent receptor [Methyloglobulus morosus]ESS72400.1 TonB-dependent receptor plug [Methyloglobulus morosus KoM1]
MSIYNLWRRSQTSGRLKSLIRNNSKSWLLSGERIAAQDGNELQVRLPKNSRAAINSIAILIAGTCLLGTNDSFAAKKSHHRIAKRNASVANPISDELAAENARLKQELERAKLENEQLKSAIDTGAGQAAAGATTDNPNGSGATAEGATAVSPGGVAAVEPQEEEKTFTSEAPKALGEVVVNSRRKEEKLQNVPLPVSVVGSETTKRDNIVTVHEITQKVPNLLFTASNARQTSIAIRGLGKNASDEARDPSVGVQVDNVPIIWPGSVFTNFVDLDHIELLRGPQGTLQGKNANLGLLNIVTKTPTWKPEYYVEGFAGNRDSLQGKVSASGPVIKDLLAYRGSFYIDRRDGFVDNLDGPVTVGKLKETDRLGGRLQFLFTPTEDLSARIILDRATATNTQIADYEIADPSRFANGDLRTLSHATRLARDHFNINGQAYKPLRGDPRKVAFDDIRASRGDQEGVSGQINWEIPRHTLTSISAYRWGLFEPHNDGDQSPYAISEIAGGTVEARQWSQELRLTSKEPGFGFIDYQVGALGLRTDNEVTSQTKYGADAGAFYAGNTAYNRLNATAVGRQLMRDSLDGLLLTSTLNPTVTSLSAFGQADLHVTDKATLTLGLRHTWEDRSNVANKFYTTPHLSLDRTNPRYAGATARNIQDAISIRGDGNSGGVLGTVYGQTERQGFDEHSQNWLMNPSYKFNDDILAYFSVSGGEKAGAALFDSQGEPENAKPEKVLDFELGVKTAWLNRKLFVNLNLYDTNVTDYQARLQVADPSVTSGFRTKTGNVGGIEMQGVELDSTWNAYEGLNLFFNGSFNHAVFTDFKNAPCAAELNNPEPCDYTGKTIPNAPLFTANFGADYRFPLGVYGLDGVAFLNNSYRSRANLNADLSPNGFQKAYHITDGGIGVATHNGKYNLSLIARNIFDTKFITNVGGLSSTGAVTGVQGEARYFGVNFRANF